MIYLDTHVVAWLYGGKLDSLSSGAKVIIEREDLLVSPAVVLELAYLQEIGRLKAVPSKIIRTLAEDLGVAVCSLAFQAVVEAALEEDWVRDPFDRLIVGHAKAGKAALVTKDERIRKFFRAAIW